MADQTSGEQGRIPGAHAVAERIVESPLGETVKAGDDRHFTALLAMGITAIKPGVTVARTWRDITLLDGGLQRLTQVTCFTPNAYAVLSDIDPVPPARARASTEITSSIPFRAFGRVNPNPRAMLAFGFYPSGRTKVSIHVQRLYAGLMVNAIRDEWPTWGFDFEYDINPRGGEVLFTPLPNMAELVLRKLIGLEKLSKSRPK